MPEFMHAVKSRRSFYGFTKEKTVPEEKIQEVVKLALTHCPSAFNSQSTRIVLLFGAHHLKLWDITLEELKKVTSPESFPKTEEKIKSLFQSGYGTILYFEDQSIVDGLIKSFPLYANNFPVWSEHTNAMHQFVVWTALETEGLGASLQHYNPLIDQTVKKEWEIPDSWKLIAQMPFGVPANPPAEKEIKPIEARFKIFK